MKRFAFAAALIAVFSSTLIQAQNIDLRANIPFDFRVGKTVMPAGEYRVHHQAGAIVLREETGRHGPIIALTRSEGRSTMLPTGNLEFNRYGNTYFLAKMWPPQSLTGITLPRTPQETELARAVGLSQRASVALAHK